jgi:hypothetical protein
MAALDFPSSPANGDKYPVPAVAGLPVYTWDGEKWTTVGGSIISGTPSNALPLMDNTPAVAGAATNYTREDHVHPVDTKAVRSDVATLWTPAQQQLARQNAYAAPFDAMAYGGLQINGGFEVSQEKGSSGTNTANTYVCDGWKIYWAGSMVLSGLQGAASIAPGFPCHLYYTVPTPQASMGASDVAFIFQPIEGYRAARLGWGTANAQPITIGFWSMHHRTGLYCVNARNGASNRSYVTTYTHNVADVAQYNVVTIPGDTGGTWTADNTAGIFLSFTMAAGSNLIAPAANTWQSGNYLAVSGQVNAVAAAADVFRLTGVIVLPGNEAPSAARSPFVMRPFDQELVICQRYYQRMLISTIGYYSTLAGGALYTSNQFATPMRAAPTAAQIGNAPTLGGCTYTLTSTTQGDVRIDVNAIAVGQNYVAGLTVALDARL